MQKKEEKKSNIAPVTKVSFAKLECTPILSTSVNEREQKIIRTELEISLTFSQVQFLFLSITGLQLNQNTEFMSALCLVWATTRAT